MDKMIQKLVQQTLSRYNEACEVYTTFDRESIPVDLITSCHIAQRPTDDALFGLYKMMADDTLDENTALVAKYLEDLEGYIIAVEKLQVAFELGKMSEEEIKAEVKNVEREWGECSEGAKGFCNVKNVNLRIYLLRMYNRHVTLVAYPLNTLIEEQKFRAAEERIRRVQYGLKFAKMLIYQVL